MGFFQVEEKIIVLLDEDRDQCGYAICRMMHRNGRDFSRIERIGQMPLDDVLDVAMHLALHQSATVICDVIPGGRLSHIARDYGWQVVMPKGHEFPFVGFICGLNRRHSGD